MGVGTHLRRCVLQDGADEAAAHLGHQSEESGEVQFNVIGEEVFPEVQTIETYIFFEIKLLQFFLVDHDNLYSTLDFIYL